MGKDELVKALIKSEQEAFDNRMKFGQYRVYSKRLVEVMKKEKLEIPSLPDVTNFSPVDDKDLPAGLE